MKYIVLFLSFFLSLQSYASVGKVSALNGEALIERGQEKITAAIGSDIKNQDTIVTLDQTKMQMIFIDKTVITLGKNTRFDVSSYSFNESGQPETEFSLAKGFMKSVTGKIGKLAPERFKVKTKDATIGIRGTTFTLETNEQFTRLTTFKGATYYQDNRTQTIYEVPKNKTLLFNHKTQKVKITDTTLENLRLRTQGDNATSLQNSLEEAENTQQSNEQNEQMQQMQQMQQNDSIQQPDDNTTGIDDNLNPNIDDMEQNDPIQQPDDNTIGIDDDLNPNIDGMEQNDPTQQPDDNTIDIDNGLNQEINDVEQNDTNTVTDTWDNSGFDSSLTDTSYIQSAIESGVTGSYTGDVIASDAGNNQGNGTINIDINFAATTNATTGNIDYTVDGKRWNSDFAGDINSAGIDIQTWNTQTTSNVISISGDLSGQFHGTNAEEMTGTFSLTGEEPTGALLESTGSYNAPGGITP